MRDLPDLTLCCVDTREPALARWAMARCMTQARFGDVVLFTSAQAAADGARDGVRSVAAQVDSIQAYSDFMLRGLAAQVHTSHALVVQWDGWVRDAAAWDPLFLQYDYIGAPWPQAKGGQWVGNGGFSLRSRRLLQALQDPDIHLSHPEDVCICVENRALLEQRHGIRFAPREIAERFSYERVPVQQPTFGVHGLFNFWREMAPAELHEFIRMLPDRLSPSLDAHDLCETLIAKRQLDTAALLLAKRRRLGMHDRRTLRLRLRLRLVQWFSGWTGRSRFNG